MTVFWIAATAFVIVALLFLLPPLATRRRRSWAVDGAGSNLSVLRDQLAELDREQAAGSISTEQHVLARSELERRVLEETRVQAQGGRPDSALKSALLLGTGIPLFAVTLYLYLGNMQALAPQAATTAEPEVADSVTAQQIEEMVNGLARKLEAQPDDAQGWVMLGRSYAALQRFDDASRAYGRAANLLPNDAQLLVDYADVLAMAHGRNVEGEPWRLVQKALEIDPANLKALALAGSVAFERKDFAAAIAYWQKAAQQAPPDNEFARALEGSLKEARALAQGGQKPPAGTDTAVAARGHETTAISGRVVLSPALAARVAPGDTVFIYARAADGPRMPVAILKRSARELPISFSLDDSLAMAPEMKLSKFTSVVVGTRVSKSGEAMPRPGDLQGQAGPINVGSRDVEIVIDKVVP